MLAFCYSVPIIILLNMYYACMAHALLRHNLKEEAIKYDKYPAFQLLTPWLMSQHADFLLKLYYVMKYFA